MEQDVEEMESSKDPNSDKISELAESNTDSIPPKTNDASMLEDVTMETSAIDSSVVDMSIASETDANTSKNRCQQTFDFDIPETKHNFT